MSQPHSITCHDVQGKAFQVSADQLSIRPAVKGVIIRENKILLVRVWDGYDFPGGGIKLGETIEEALKREIKEETGYDIAPGRLLTGADAFYKIFHKEKFVQSILLYYACTITGSELSTALFTEKEKEFMKKAEWIELSKIKDITFYNSVDSLRVIDLMLKNMV